MHARMHACTHPFLFIQAGVQCQSFTDGDVYCPGNDITFTCVTSTSSFVWIVRSNETLTSCLAFRDGRISVPMCGPMNRFTVGVSEDGSSSTLSVQAVDSVVNETTIQCVDGDVNESICIIG